MQHPSRSADQRLPRVLAVLGAGAGFVLLVIGVRFLAWPQAATWAFGLGGRPTPVALDALIGLRDVWLALLAVAFAILRERRALALWLLLGAGVCVGDALVVGWHGGPWPALAFHAASGVFCAVVGWRCWRPGRRAD